MPTNLHARDFLVLWSKGTTWGTFDTSAGVNDGHLILSEDLGVLPRESLKDESVGDRNAFVQTQNKGNFPADTKSVRGWMRFDMSEFPVAFCMGTTTISGAAAQTGAYLHTVRPKADIDGTFSSFAVEKKDGTIIHSYPSVKVDGFEITGEAGGMLEITFSVYASHFVNSGGATTTMMDNLTHRTKTLRIPFNNAQFLINDQSDTTFDTTADLMKPSRMAIRFNRNLEAYHAAQGVTTSAAYRVEEPTGGAFPEIELELEFPTKTVDTWVTDLGADTKKKMRLIIDSGVAAGSDTYDFRSFFTNMEITNLDDATDGAGKIVNPLTFSCLKASSAPSGCAGQTDPVFFQFVNTVATALLNI